MQEENISSDILNEEKPKKVRRRTTKTTVHKPIDNTSEEKIERQLSNIYRDDNGRMPDMRQIKKAGGGSFIVGLFKFVFTVAILGALAWGGFFLLPTTNKFSDSQVDLKIIGPENFSIGATTTYQIVFKNNQNINLNKASLLINYPAGFVFSQSSLDPTNAGKNEWNIGTIKPNEEKTLQITGNLFGSIGEAQSWRIFLNYSPENIKSEMQKIITFNVKPDQAPITVSLVGLDKVPLDTTSTYTISVESKNNLIGKNLIVVPSFPTNFSITSSSPALEKNVWNLLATASTASTKFLITFTGKFSNTEENNLPLKVQIKLASPLRDNYLLAESVLNTELIKNSVVLNTAVNGSLTNIESKPGDILNFTIALKNSGKNDISKAQIKLIIDSPSYKKQSVLSWPDIIDKNDGALNGSQISDAVRRATLTWNGKKINTLTKIKAGDEVLVDFQLPIKNSDKAPWNDIINNQIQITSEMTFTDATKAIQTIVGNPINITLNSDLAIQIKNDISSDSQSRESHDIVWIITNTFHPLKNIVLSADIYGDIIWQGPSSTSAGTIQFDPKTKHLTWAIADMTENSDVLDLPFTVILNKKDPTQNTLVSKVHLTADDTVSGNKLDLLGDEIPLNN